MTTAQAAGGATIQGGHTTRGAEIIRVLSADGTIVDKSKEPELTDEVLLDLYRALVRTRVVDDVATELWEDKRIPFHSSSRGEEAASVGSAWALRAQDWMFPAHRDVGGALVRGMTVEQYADHLFGNGDDVAKGRQMPDHFTHRASRLASIGSLLGSQIVHAAGFAWAAKLRGDPIAVLACLGESAIGSGGFHDGMNFAGVFRTPSVFLCRNASGVPVEDVGAAYGVASIRCDGSDLLAVIDATRHAVARAVGGDGATFIEAMVARTDDPLPRVRHYIEARMRFDEAADEAIWSEVKAEVSTAFERAASKGPPPLASMFDDVYEARSARLATQAGELERGPRYPGRETDG